MDSERLDYIERVAKAGGDTNEYVAELVQHIRKLSALVHEAYVEGATEEIPGFMTHLIDGYWEKSHAKRVLEDGL